LVARRSDRFGIRPRANRARFGTRNLPILPNIRIATAEIALFILLPRVPLLLMVLVFVRERDFRFVFLAAVVLRMIHPGLAVRASALGSLYAYGSVSEDDQTFQEDRIDRRFFRSVAFS
jgi:hypothetical protein